MSTSRGTETPDDQLYHDIARELRSAPGSPPEQSTNFHELKNELQQKSQKLEASKAALLSYLKGEELSLTGVADLAQGIDILRGRKQRLQAEIDEANRIGLTELKRRLAESGARDLENRRRVVALDAVEQFRRQWSSLVHELQTMETEVTSMEATLRQGDAEGQRLQLDLRGLQERLVHLRQRDADWQQETQAVAMASALLDKLQRLRTLPSLG